MPVLEEEAGDVVAGFEAGDGGADGDDDAGGVGAGDAGEGHFGVVGAEDDHEVAEVEAGGVEVDEDFGGAGVGEGEGGEGEGCCAFGRAEGVEAEGGGGHAVLLESVGVAIEADLGLKPISYGGYEYGGYET